MRAISLSARVGSGGRLPRWVRWLFVVVVAASLYLALAAVLLMLKVWVTGFVIDWSAVDRSFAETVMEWVMWLAASAAVGLLAMIGASWWRGRAGAVGSPGDSL